MHRLSRCLILGLCLAVTVAEAHAQLPAPPQDAEASRPPFAKPGALRQTGRIREYDVKHIKAELTLDVDKKEVRGKVVHTAAPLHPFLTRVELDRGRNLKIESATIADGGASLPFKVEGEKLIVTLDKARPQGEDFDLTVVYSGKPEQGLHFILPDAAHPDRQPAIWTQGEAEETRHWLPCYDYPNDQATTEMIVTVARPLSVVSNGVLVETKENPDGTRTFHWKMDQPHSSYLITMAASDFASFHDKLGDLPIDYYVAKSVDEATARRFMGKTPQMVEFFSEVTAQPFPYPKYAQVCLPEFNGGMENSSATSMTDEALLDETEALERDHHGLVAHELAHQWFGDLMTCKDWSHIWLNEGFASYFDPLFVEHDRGEDEFRLKMRKEQNEYLAADKIYRRPIVEPRYDSPTQLFDGMTYAKGGSTLHMLRGYLGDEAWWKGIRHYVAKRKFQNVETDDFRKDLEEATGKDLNWFFDQWLHKAGHPELKLSWRYEPEDKTVRVKVEQTQKLDEQTPLFRLPTTIEITEAPGCSRSVPIVIDGSVHEFVIASETEPKMVLVDPKGWLIKEVDFPKPVAESLFQLEHAGSVVDRLAAAVALSKQANDHPEVKPVLAAAWTKEQSAVARAELVGLLPSGDEAFRADLLAAAKDPEARVRVAAVSGLARLKRDEASEAVLRAVWNDPKEAYGARRAALRGLSAWKVKDADDLLTAALGLSIGKHTLAAEALELFLEESSPKAREMAALYSRFGQPRRLRFSALEAFERLAKDDAALQDMIVPMVEDPDRNVRVRVWRLAQSLKLKKALPVLESRLETEDFGFNAFARQVLEEAVKTLKEPDEEPKAAPAAAAQPEPREEPSLEGDELDRQIQELRIQMEELQGIEFKQRIQELLKQAEDLRVK